MANDDIKKATEDINEAIGAAGGLEEGLTDVKNVALSLTEVLKGNATSLSSFLGGAKISATELREAYQSATNKAIEMNNQTGDGLVKTASIFSTILMPELTKGSNMFGKIGDEGVDASQRISSSFSSLQPVLAKLGIGGGILDGVTELYRLTEQSRSTEIGLMKMAAQSGSLNSFMKDGALDTATMTNASAAYSKRLEETGNATGRLSSELDRYRDNLRGISNSMDTFIAVNEDGSDSMDLFTASIRLADGLMMEHEDVTSFLTKTHNKFGTSVENSMRNLSAFRNAAQDLKLPMEIMDTYMEKATSGISSMGDASDSAVKLISSLGKALGDTGSSKQAIADITGGMLEGAKSMDIGQASYVNQASGGRGGLAGGFEIELLKQQGNFGEIISRTMSAMENTGLGAPVTLEDVQENPALAGQLMKQTEMLEKFGLAQNKQEAFKVLAAMQEGGTEKLQDALKDMKSPQDAMIDALKLGNEIAKGAPNQLVKLLNAGQRGLRGKANLDLESLKDADKFVGGNYITDLHPQGLSTSLSGKKIKSSTGEITGAKSSTNITDRDEIAGRASDLLEEGKALGSSLADLLGKDGIAGRINKAIKKKMGLTENDGKDKLPDGSKMKDDVARARGSGAQDPGGSRDRNTPQEVVIDGVLKVEVDVKDGMITIAKKEFSRSWRELEKSKNNQAIIGVNTQE